MDGNMHHSKEPVFLDGEEVTETYYLLDLLTEELLKTRKINVEDDRSFTERVLVRVLFSNIDAYCFYLKTLIWHSPAVDLHPFLESLSKNAREILEEGRGKPATGTLKKNLLTSVRCYAKVRKIDSLIHNDLPKEFDVCVDIRHRLTHPKKRSDYVISAEEREALNVVLALVGKLIAWTLTVENNRHLELQAWFEEIKKASRQ